MQIDWWTLGLQTINLLVLVWILGRFLFRPIADIIARRQTDADRLLDDANALREQAKAAEHAAERSAAEAAATRRELLETATDEASREKERLFAAARKDAQDLREQAKAEIERMQQAETARNDVRASALAVDIASRLFERLPDDARIAGFVDGLADALRDLPQAARDEFGAGGSAVSIKVARSLSESEEQSVREALSGVLGREVALAITVDPSLIAGIEIETAHASVRNSLRADLDRIAAEINPVVAGENAGG